MADVNQKYARQAKQSDDSVSQKAENTIKDFVEISSDARQWAREPKDEMAEMASKYQELKEQLEKAREQGDAMAESMQTRTKCLLIAMRIMSGDKVPIEDQRYLADKDPELFAKSNMMKLQNPDPKEHDRISEDEELTDEDSAREPGVSAASENQSAGGEVSVEASEGASADGGGD